MKALPFSNRGARGQALVFALCGLCIATAHAQPAPGASARETPTIRCVVVGDGAVGKTSMLISYTTNAFPGEYIPTSFDTYAADVVVDGQPTHLELVDTPGGADYDRIRPLAYPDTDVFLLAFSVSSRESAESVPGWMDELHRHAPGVPVILVGTKTDLRNDTAMVRHMASRGQILIGAGEGRELARNVDAQDYSECSALTQEGLKAVFENAVRWARRGKEPKEPGSGKPRLAIQPDPGNVVASRLEGTWILDQKSTDWFGGTAAIGLLLFTNDPTALDDLPEEMAAEVSQDRIYMAGRMDNSATLEKGRQEHRFLLIERNGNMCLVPFKLQRQGEPAGKVVPEIVTLAASADGRHDLLLLFGESRNGACIAFGRENRN